MSTHRASVSEGKRTLTEMEKESIAALSALLQGEADPMYACGRSYIAHLARWRDYLAEAPSTVSAPDSRVAAGPSGRSYVDDDDGDDSAKVPPGKKQRVCYVKVKPVDEPVSKSKLPNLASPDRIPNTLIDWRSRISEWYFKLTDSLKYERNVAIVALSYLDTYAMQACFPAEFSRTTSKSSEPPIGGKDAVLDSTEKSIHGIYWKDYLLFATSSFYVAAKVWQSGPSGIMSSNQASNLWRGQLNFSAEDIERAEIDLLRTLKFQVHTPTAKMFIRELLPLLLPQEASRDEGVSSKTEIRWENRGKDEAEIPFQGTFGSCRWDPKDGIQNGIQRDANFLVEVVSYSSYFPYVSSASPSKIALAAIVEATGHHYHVMDDIDQASFRDRVHNLCELPEFSQGKSASFSALAYDDEVRHIQNCLSILYKVCGEDTDVETEQCRDSTISPVTVVSSVGGIRMSCTSPKKPPSPVVPFDQFMDNYPKFTAAASSCNSSAIKENKISPEKKSSHSSSDGSVAANLKFILNQKRSESGKHLAWERADQCKSAAQSLRGSMSAGLVVALKSAVNKAPNKPKSSNLISSKIAPFNAPRRMTKPSRCTGGRSHRMWERADQCSAAATASRRSLSSDLALALENACAVDKSTHNAIPEVVQ